MHSTIRILRKIKGTIGPWTSGLPPRTTASNEAALSVGTKCASQPRSAASSEVNGVIVYSGLRGDGCRAGSGGPCNFCGSTGCRWCTWCDSTKSRKLTFRSIKHPVNRSFNSCNTKQRFSRDLVDKSMTPLCPIESSQWELSIGYSSAILLSARSWDNRDLGW